mgnify:CR=1 FL=1
MLTQRIGSFELFLILFNFVQIDQESVELNDSVQKLIKTSKEISERQRAPKNELEAVQVQLEELSQMKDEEIGRIRRDRKRIDADVQLELQVKELIIKKKEIHIGQLKD